MKILKTTAIAAMLSCSMMTPANAAITPTTTPSLEVTSQMTQQCADYVTSLNQQFAWQNRTFTKADVENVTYYITWEAAPFNKMEIAGSRAPAAGATVVSFSNIDASGVNPAGLGRTGGSVNLFAPDAKAHTVTYSNSTYSTTDTYNGTVNYGYHCTPYERITTPATVIRETQGDCASRHAKDDVPNGAGGIAPGDFCNDQVDGVYINRLILSSTPGSTTEERVIGLSYGYPYPGNTGAVTAPITGTDTGFEPNGGAFTFQNQNLTVTALVCNNPGSKGGLWRPQNLYGGANCNTAFFSTAPTLSGNNFGPYVPSNSLPN